MRCPPYSLAISISLILISPAAVRGQQRELPDIPEERLTAFARAHVEISSVRDSLYDAFGRIHDAQGKARLRERLSQRIAQIIETQGISSTEFQRITFVISSDSVRRKAFETILKGLEPGDAGGQR